MWRLRPWNANPLMRGSDRFEGAIRLLVVALMLVMVPVSGAVGTARYTAAAEQIRSEHAEKVPVTAVVVAAPFQAMVYAPSHRDLFEAPVQWKRDGRTVTVVVAVPETTAIGAEVWVWLGPDGKPTDPPKQTPAAMITGIGTGLRLLLITWSGGLALVWVAGCVLGSRRRAQWASEWRRIGRPIGA